MDFPFVKQAISQLFSKPSCDMYPFVPSEAAPNYRGRIAYDPNKCIGCGMCVRVCAGKAITLTREPVEGGENITLTFDLGSCTFCNTCADFCNEHAITLTSDYHMIATKEEDLLVTGTHFKEKKKPAPKPAAAKLAVAPAEAAPAKGLRPKHQPRKKQPLLTMQKERLRRLLMPYSPVTTASRSTIHPNVSTALSARKSVRRKPSLLTARQKPGSSMRMSASAAGPVSLPARKTPLSCDLQKNYLRVQVVFSLRVTIHTNINPYFLFSSILPATGIKRSIFRV